MNVTHTRLIVASLNNPTFSVLFTFLSCQRSVHNVSRTSFTTEYGSAYIRLNNMSTISRCCSMRVILTWDDGDEMKDRMNCKHKVRMSGRSIAFAVSSGFACLLCLCMNTNLLKTLMSQLNASRSDFCSFEPANFDIASSSLSAASVKSLCVLVRYDSIRRSHMCDISFLTMG